MEKETRIYLFGTGGFAERYTQMVKELIKDASIRILGFLDHNKDKCNLSYKGYKIFSVESINPIEYDKIVVFLYNESYENAKEELIIKDGIDSDRIISILDLVNLVNSMHREKYSMRMTHPRRIYDCFPFFNEIDILKIRMKLLAPYVDFFVLVEMEKDHRGRNKPLFFKENERFFEEYNDKIIYVCPEELPEYKNIGEGKDFTLENFQRNSILNGLKDAETEDIICISDCDEIPNPSIFDDIKKANEKGVSLDRLLDENLVGLEQDFMHYYFNCVHKVKWVGSVMIKAKNLVLPQMCRELAYIYYLPVPGRQYNNMYFPKLKNGGWHLTYFGEVDKILLKTKTLVSGTDVSEEELKDRIKNGLDPYGRQGVEYELQFVDDKEISISDFQSLKREFPMYYHEMEE